MSQKLKNAFKSALPIDDLRRMLTSGQGQSMIIAKIAEFKTKQGLEESVSVTLDYKKGVYKDLLDLFEPYTDPKVTLDQTTYERRLDKLLRQEKMRNVEKLPYDSFKQAREQAAASRRVMPGTPKVRGAGAGAGAGKAEEKAPTKAEPERKKLRVKATVTPRTTAEPKEETKEEEEQKGEKKESESTSSPPGEPVKLKGRKPRKKTGEKSGTRLKTPSKETLAAEAKARGAPAPVPASAPAPAPAPAPAEKKDSRLFDPKISDADPIPPLPTKGQMIPSSRLSASGKKTSELRDDIRYFLNNFPDLEREAEIYKKLGSRATKTDLVRLHSRIVGKVRPAEDPRTDSQGRRVGVVLDGESYIRGLVNDMLTDQRMSGLRPEGLVSVNERDGAREDGVRDIGDFEVKPAPDGGFAAKREAIYRFQPSENEKEVNPTKSKNKRFTISKSGKGERMNNLRTNALKSFKRDPFTTKQPVRRLNYLF